MHRLQNKWESSSEHGFPSPLCRLRDWCPASSLYPNETCCITRRPCTQYIIPRVSLSDVCLEAPSRCTVGADLRSTHRRHQKFLVNSRMNSHLDISYLPRDGMARHLMLQGLYTVGGNQSCPAHILVHEKHAFPHFAQAFLEFRVVSSRRYTTILRSSRDPGMLMRRVEIIVQVKIHLPCTTEYIPTKVLTYVERLDGMYPSTVGEVLAKAPQLVRGNFYPRADQSRDHKALEGGKARPNSGPSTESDRESADPMPIS